MTIWDTFLWVVLPYAALVLFLGGHVWRYRRDKFGWTSRSTQILESRWLAWGSNLFHYGALGAIAGHVIGILIPNWLTSAIGISEFAYHFISAIPGSIAGLVCTAGLIILIARRSAFSRIRRLTTAIDIAVYVLLAALVGLGTYATVFVNAFGAGYDYRSTVAIWFRGLFWLHPQPQLMATAPLVYQLHTAIPWALYALWPFSRLVHVWSLPLQYLGRPYVLYRSRLAVARR